MGDIISILLLSIIIGVLTFMLILRLDECSPITVPLIIIKDASFIKVIYIYIKTNYIFYIISFDNNIKLIVFNFKQ